MTGNVVKLAEASGHSAAEGINGLTRAMQTGRVQSLAAATGLTRVQLQVAELPLGLSRAHRATLEFTHALEVLEKQANRLGELPLTIERAEQQLRIAANNVALGFGKGFNESEGTQVFLKTLGGLAKDINALATISEKVGRVFGQSMAVAGPILIWLKALLGNIFSFIGDIAVLIGKTFGASIPNDINKTAFAIKLVGGGFLVLSEILNSIAKSVSAIFAPLGDIMALAMAKATGNVHNFAKAMMDLKADIKKLPEDLGKAWNADTL